MNQSDPGPKQRHWVRVVAPVLPIAAAVLAAFWLTGVIGTFEKVFDDFDTDLPQATSLVLSVPRFAWWLMPVAVAVVSIAKNLYTDDVPVCLFIDVCLLFVVFVVYELARLSLEQALLKLFTDLT